MKKNKFDLIASIFDGIDYRTGLEWKLGDGLGLAGYNHNPYEYHFYWTMEGNDIIIDVPGCSKDDISIEVKDSQIIVLANKKEMAIYFDSSKFDIDGPAECKNGQLIISLKENKSNIKKIEVK